MKGREADRMVFVISALFGSLEVLDLNTRPRSTELCVRVAILVPGYVWTRYLTGLDHSFSLKES